MLVTVYVGLFLFLPQTFGALSRLRENHTPHDIGVVILFALSIALVFWVDVALVISERARTRANAGTRR